MAEKQAAGSMLVKLGITVLIAVVALLMFGPLLAVVTGGEYRGSASLDLGRGDRVTILTTVPDPSQAPKCTATGPGGATMSPSGSDDVFDINGVRYYPTVEFTAGGDGAFAVECADGALFKTDVTTAGFSFANLLKGGIPTPVLLGVSVAVIMLLLFARKRRSERAAPGDDAEPDRSVEVPRPQD